MALRESQKTQWVFTLNNPDKQVETDDPQRLDYRYLVWQLERGDSGTPHLQGMVVLNKKARLSTLKKSLPRAHFEPMRGTVEQAAAYCQKEEGRLEGPWVRGEYCDRGTRSDLVTLRSDLDSGMTMLDVSENHFSNFLRYGRGIKEYRLLHSLPRAWKTEVWFFYGPTNSGKTYTVHKLAPGVFVKPHGTWFTGFDNHTDVILDEFTSTKYGKITDLNQWLDQYKCTVPVHGGTVNFNPLRIWITSNIPPQDLFPKVLQEKPELVRAFWSRVEYIFKFKSDRTCKYFSEMYIGPIHWLAGNKRL